MWYNCREVFMDYRKEKDSFGEIEIESGALWGAQTERSRRNFRIGQQMPKELVYALANVKKAAAKANAQLGALDAQTERAIVAACELILSGGADDMFPLVVFQTGSGTQTNMNLNEVISRLCSQNGVQAHANDKVNMSQSTNDVFPTAIHVCCAELYRTRLRPALKSLAASFGGLKKKYGGIVKSGRTHLQDATPVTFGSELGAFETLIENDLSMIDDSMKYLYALPLGGTAVGTGLNAPAGFDKAAVKCLSEIYGLPFVPAKDKFAGLSSKNSALNFHGALNTLAADLLKIAGDVRFLACGPDTGIAEISLPANEPGSSIMPGKVNPTQCEAMIMVCCEVFGNHQTITAACALGQLQLNACMPVIAFKAIESINLLAQAAESFDKNCVAGIVPNERRMKDNLDKNLMLATALSPVVGYDRAAFIVKTARKEGLTLKQAALKLGFLTEEQFDKAIEKATQPQ